MTCLPSQIPDIREIEQSYQHWYSGRVHRMRISGGALLVAIVIHAALGAKLVATLIERGSPFPLEHLEPYASATLFVLPLTLVIAHAYARSRAGARQTRARLNEIRRMKQDLA